MFVTIYVSVTTTTTTTTSNNLVFFARAGIATLFTKNTSNKYKNIQEHVNKKPNIFKYFVTYFQYLFNWITIKRQ